MPTYQKKILSTLFHGEVSVIFLLKTYGKLTSSTFPGVLNSNNIACKSGGKLYYANARDTRTLRAQPPLTDVEIEAPCHFPWVAE